jgi:hypothetical protein
MSESGTAGGGPSAQETYWNQLVLLKVVSGYVRRHRDAQAWWINKIGLFKAIATSGTIGAWAVWKEYAFVWGLVLGAAQILDAAKDYIPRIKNRRNASDFVSVIENIIIDARFEWYEIFDGKYPADEIMARWRKLAKLLLETEGKYFPDGLPDDPGRQRLAEQDASAYFLSNYGVGGLENG